MTNVYLRERGEAKHDTEPAAGHHRHAQIRTLQACERAVLVTTT